MFVFVCVLFMFGISLIFLSEIPSILSLCEKYKGQIKAIKRVSSLKFIEVSYKDDNNEIRAVSYKPYRKLKSRHSIGKNISIYISSSNPNQFHIIDYKL